MLGVVRLVDECAMLLNCAMVVVEAHPNRTWLDSDKAPVDHELGAADEAAFL